ncbi:hypothetical protein LDENG_00297220 [Lucifuga dentata]|nr:hypothetical protein LDENG_00297220 [Lucifuga dentata]
MSHRGKLQYLPTSQLPQEMGSELGLNTKAWPILERWMRLRVELQFGLKAKCSLRPEQQSGLKLKPESMPDQVAKSLPRRGLRLEPVLGLKSVLNGGR